MPPSVGVAVVGLAADQGLSKAAASFTTPSAPTWCAPAGSATEDDLWDGLRHARLDGLVRALSDGLDPLIRVVGLMALPRWTSTPGDGPAVAPRRRAVIWDEAIAPLHDA
ncbi:hypothetical protein AB5J72_02720 [Streptomyces sp. CG1]|uniref:hypothetical protein n=1 Tax=Streptomyces sp. CG1 TaxID=1287523 RepID=UPI0034E2B20F